MFLSRRNYRHPEFRRGALDAMAAAPGIAAWGLMMGVTTVKAGLSTFESLLMSLIVFAGSSQLAALPLLTVGAPMWVILATGFCVNLRFVVFSAHLRPYMMHLPLWQRLLSGYLTTDLSYVLFINRFPSHGGDAGQLQAQQAYLMGNCGVNWVSWVGCSVIGVLLANLIPTHWGLGFAGNLALLGIMCSLASSRLRWASAAVAGVTAVLVFGLPFKLNILVAIGAAVALCLALEDRLLQQGDTHEH
jgi:predicted branched-subunit amino acid permease